MGGTGDDAGVQVPADPAAETAGVKPTEKLPTDDPGQPPAKKSRPGGRQYAAVKAAKEAAAAAALEAARRAEQAPLAAKLLTPVWSWGFRVTGGILKADYWALTDKESAALGDGAAEILVKYFDLDILLRYQEEIAFAYLLAKVVEPRLAKANEEAARADAIARGDNSGSAGVGQVPAPEKPAARKRAKAPRRN